MEMSPGTLPHPGRVPEWRLLSPEICLRRQRRCGTVLEISSIPLGFSIPRLYIGEGASSGGCRVSSHLGGVARGWATPPWCEGSPWPPSGSHLVLILSSGKNKTSGTCFVQFREYFMCSFSETQK
jgi:hypothetical protein